MGQGRRQLLTLARTLHGTRTLPPPSSSSFSPSYSGHLLPPRSRTRATGIALPRYRTHAAGFALPRFQSGVAGFSSSGQDDNGTENVTDVGYVDCSSEIIEENMAVVSESVQRVSEVATVIGDCWFPVAWLQLLVESVHIHVGMPWWASIAATSIAMRTFMVPVTIYQMKMSARLNLMRPETLKLMEEMKTSGYNPEVVKRVKERVKELYRIHKASPLSPMVGLFVQAPVFAFFFFGIRNMAARVPSFETGGALWFTDLSTPDEFYILPALTSLTFLLSIELGLAEGMEGNPQADKMKKIFRIFSVVLIPLTMTFEKALFCYWLTSNVFSLCQGAILKKPSVKAALGIPDTSHLSQNVSNDGDSGGEVSQQEESVKM